MVELTASEKAITDKLAGDAAAIKTRRAEAFGFYIQGLRDAEKTLRALVMTQPAAAITTDTVLKIFDIFVGEVDKKKPDDA